MELIIIAAMSRNRVIGVNGRLPWDIPEDTQWFKGVTTGHPVIMGRYTFESLKKPLPNRLNIVLTQTSSFRAPSGCLVYDSLEKAILKLQGQDCKKAFVIGGEQVYREAMDYADWVYLTVVDRHVFIPSYPSPTDVIEFIDDYAIFPEVPESVFQKVSIKLKDTQPPTHFEVWQRFPYAYKKPLDEEE